MEVFIGLFIFVMIALSSYVYLKKQNTDLKNKLSSMNNTKLVEAQEELLRRSRIVEKVDSFLKKSKFFEPIANWRGDKIYKYIFSDGYLYEFEEIMAENNQRIGLDEEFLCFKQLSYKRVNNPEQFIKKFSSELNFAN